MYNPDVQKQPKTLSLDPFMTTKTTSKESSKNDRQKLQFLAGALASLTRCLLGEQVYEMLASM